MELPAVAVRDDRDRASRRDLPVELDPLGELLATVLASEGVPARAEASLQLVSSEVISELNAQHLGGEGPTDVLSFPIDGAGATDPGADVPGPDDDWLVGDVVVCAEVAAAQAADHAGTLPDELALLVVHGGLHLCGWDHADAGERSAMWERERELLATVGRLPSRDPWSAA